MTDTDITHEICRMAADAVDELEKANASFAQVEIRVEWLGDPLNRHGITNPVTSIRTATWVGGEWTLTRYERTEKP